MADFLDTTIMVNYVRENIPENIKLINMKQKVMSSAYESGERTLQAIDQEVKLVDNVTHFYLFASNPVTISLSDGTVFEKMTQFAYGSINPMSISVSNTSSQVTKIIYASGLRSNSSSTGGCTCLN